MPPAQPTPARPIWNGLSKFMLATYPLVVMWACWVTVETVANREFRNRGDRFTQEDALRMELDMRKEIAALPPADWKDKINETAKTVNANALRLAEIDGQLKELKRNLSP